MVYVVWFLFCWVGAARFRPSRPFALFSSRLCLLPPFQSSREDCSDAALTHAVWSARFIFVYGMQIYNLLGNEAQARLVMMFWRLSTNDSPHQRV